MKKGYFISLIFILLVNLVGCSSRINSSGKPPWTSDKLEELVEISPLIVECKVIGNEKKFSFDNAKYVKVDVSVKNVTRENYGVTVNSVITILQSDTDEISPLKKGEDLVLLLDKYEGPVTQNSYAIIGGDKGQIQLINDKLHLKSINSGGYYEDIKKNDINSFKELIKNKPFNSKKKSIEKIKKENEREMELYNSQQRKN